MSLAGTDLAQADTERAVDERLDMVGRDRCSGPAGTDKPAGSASMTTTSMPAFPVLPATAKRLPPGVIYLEAGPPGHPPRWISLWAISRGRERLVTPGEAGRQIYGFGASRAGIVVMDGASSPAGLARWTRRGLVWLHPAGHPRWTINGFWPDISPAGAITYMLFAHGNAASIWIRPSWTGRDKIIYRWPDMRGSVAQVFGPRDRLAVMPIAMPLPKGKPGLVVLTPRGAVVRRLQVGLPAIAPPEAWGPRAPALALRSPSGRAELLFLSGRREPLPAGWKPLAWNPAGSELLMASSTSLGIWSTTRPRSVRVIGPISRGYGIWDAVWLSAPART